jgi:hypothetical protein
VGTHAARSLALGIGIGALALGPGAGVAGAGARSATSQAVPGDRALRRPGALAPGLPAGGRGRAHSRAAHAVGRLHFLIEDG